MSFYITNHCKERYAQRIGELRDIKEVLKQVYDGKDITNEVFDKYPRYILYLYERYGNCNMKIIKYNDVVFITRKHSGTLNKYDVVTCYLYGNFDKFGDTVLSRQEIFIRIKLMKAKLNK